MNRKDLRAIIIKEFDSRLTQHIPTEIAEQVEAYFLNQSQRIRPDQWLSAVAQGLAAKEQDIEMAYDEGVVREAGRLLFERNPELFDWDGETKVDYIYKNNNQAPLTTNIPAPEANPQGYGF